MIIQWITSGSGSQHDEEHSGFEALWHSQPESLRKLLRQYPKSAHQRRHQAVLKELVKNGNPYLALDIETVQLLGLGHRAERLRKQLLAGYPVDKILRDRGSWYVTFQHKDCALHAAWTINLDGPLVSAHHPPAIPTRSLERCSGYDTTAPDSYSNMAQSQGSITSYNSTFAQSICSTDSFPSVISATSGKRRVLDLRTNQKKQRKPGAACTTQDKNIQRRARPVSPTSSISGPQDYEPPIVISSTTLGRGSQGVVCQGLLRGGAVAIKRVWDAIAANREIDALRDIETHPNIIRYYYHEHSPTLTHIVTELCAGSLTDFIARTRRDRYSSLPAGHNVLKQISAGVGHLHVHDIVHRDLKPDNILLKKSATEEGGYRVVITDFGLSTRLENGVHIFLVADIDVLTGTPGWRAPEILKKLGTRTQVGERKSPDRPIRFTKAVDIFALGCLFHYILTNGEHPFGDQGEREYNILRDVKDLDDLDSKEALDLVEWMLAFDAGRRPDISKIMLHPYFWSAAKCLNFLQDVSDHLEHLRQKPTTPILKKLEHRAHEIIGINWGVRLDQCFVKTHRRDIKYNMRSIQHLLRTIRNNKHHYHNIPGNVKQEMGCLPHGFLAYFTERFPHLFVHVYHIVKDSEPLRNTPDLRAYFTELTD